MVHMDMDNAYVVVWRRAWRLDDFRDAEKASRGLLWIPTASGSRNPRAMALAHESAAAAAAARLLPLHCYPTEHGLWLHGRCRCCVGFAARTSLSAPRDPTFAPHGSPIPWSPCPCRATISRCGCHRLFCLNLLGSA